MSYRSSDNTYRCDRCNDELENGGVHEAAVISDLQPDTDGTRTRILHLCRKNGCDRKVLTKRALRAYIEAKDTP